MLQAAAILCLSFLLDLLIGDPVYRFHPVRIIGWIISFIEQKLKFFPLKTQPDTAKYESRIFTHGSDCDFLIHPGWFSLEGKAGGILLVLIVSGITIVSYLSAHILLHGIHRIIGICFDVFICYSTLALKDLVHHVKSVKAPLEKEDLHEAREAVSMIVGRKVSCLDQAAIARAAIETLAENFVDGFLSPVFWYCVGAMAAFLLDFAVVPTALCFMLLFKAASTLDSMVGYKTVRFRELGWAGARLDDIMNFIPARLSLILLFLGAGVSGLHPVDGLLIALRDRLKHASPNSAHAESFFAGSLHCRLGGSITYPDGLHAREWLGGEYPDPSLTKISAAIRMTIFSAVIIICFSLCAIIVLAG
jgi:adenosylcobinamide-phosphate synthase